MRKVLDGVCLTLIIVGALNWGLIGLFNFDFVSTVIGGYFPVIAKAIFVLIGIAALYSLSLFGYLDKTDTYAYES